MDAAIIERQALSLSEGERALLADRLIESLSPVTRPVQEAWIEEADSRMRAFREGRIEALPGPEAIKDLRGRLGL